MELHGGGVVELWNCEVVLLCIRTVMHLYICIFVYVSSCIVV